MLDFWLSVAVLAIAPLWMAVYGGLVAAEAIDDIKHRRNVKLKFWGIALFGLLITMLNQYRAMRADARRESVAEQNREAVKQWQTDTTQKLDVIIKQPVSLDQQRAATELKRQVATPPSRDSVRQLTLEIGPSTDSRYAFETRFILTNSKPLPISKGAYICQLPKQENGLLHLNKPIAIYPAAAGPIADLPPGKSYSLYCDFTAAGFMVDSLDRIPVQIWISYTYNQHEQSEGFQFLALRKPEDKTFVWLPRGAALSSYGNLRARLINTSQRILSEIGKLARQGASSGGWEGSNEFRRLYLSDVRELRSECADLHFKDDDLDKTLSAIDSLTSMNSQYSISWPQMQFIAQRLVELANKIPD